MVDIMKKMGVLVIILILFGLYCFNSNKKTLDLPDASKVEFAHVHGGATTTVYELNQTTISSLIKDIEEPYNGVWKIPSDLYKTIKNNKDKLIVEYED